MFDDTEVSTISKVILPQWEELFNKINQECYVYFTPHNDPNVRMLDDQVFPKIQKSYLNMVAYQSPIFPCIKTLRWIIDHTYVKNAQSIMNRVNVWVSFFQ